MTTLTSKERPKFNSKTVILIFSVLMSTFFGSLLFAQNLRELEKRKETYYVVLFAIVWNIVTIKAFNLFIYNPLISYILDNIIGGIIIVFPFWDHYLGDVTEYNKRKAWLPVIIFLVIGLSYLALLFSQR